MAGKDQVKPGNLGLYTEVLEDFGSCYKEKNDNGGGECV